MRQFTALLIVAVLAVPVTWSGELAGVSFPDEVTVDDATLVLNGIGLRKKFVVKVYVAGLYLSKKTADAESALSADGPKRVVMKFMTNKATKKKMDAAWRDGFEANSPTEYEKLEKRVHEFAGLFGDMKDGDVIEMTMIPGQGTAISFNGEDKGVIEGDDFSSALLKVWLGDHPPTDDLKTGMLGG